MKKADFLAISGYIWNNKELNPLEALKKIEMKITCNEIKPGMLIEHKNDLWEVVKTQHVKPGKGGAFNQVEMKSINKNTKLNEDLDLAKAVEKASIEELKYNYLYDDENLYYFMNPSDFEQTNIKKDQVGEKGNF